MGSGSSALIKTDKPVDASQSAGFHIIEIHRMTAGIGFVVVMVLLGLCFICAYASRRVDRRWIRRNGASPRTTIEPEPRIIYVTQRPRRPITALQQPRFQEVTEPNQHNDPPATAPVPSSRHWGDEDEQEDRV